MLERQMGGDRARKGMRQINCWAKSLFFNT